MASAIVIGYRFLLFSLEIGLVSIRVFGAIEFVLGLLLLLINLLWCTVLPAGSLTWLYWIEVVFSILIVIVAAAAMATKPK